MPVNNSMLSESAIGMCNFCGASLSFDPNNFSTTCKCCYSIQTRATSGACSDRMQRAGYRPGTGVNLYGKNK